MTINELLAEIDQHFNYWMGTYHRRELSVNDVRIVSEAIAKCIVLKNKGNTDGNNILFGKSIEYSYLRETNASGSLSFYENLRLLEEINGFNGNNRAKKHIELIKVITDQGSHSKFTDKQKISEDDLDSCNISIKYLIKWLYINKLKLPLSKSIADALEGSLSDDNINYLDDEWKEFLLDCDNYDDKRNQYILVAPEHISDNIFTVENILRLPWRLILDFNPKSDEQEIGLLRNFNRIRGSGYKKSFVLNDRIDFDPGFKHYWFFSNGQGSIAPINDFILWRRNYKRFLSDKLYSAFQKGSKLKSRIVVFLNIPPKYVEAIVDEFNVADEQNIRFVICSDDTESYDNVFEIAKNVTKVRITADEIAESVNRSARFEVFNHSNKLYQIPVIVDDKKIFINISQDHHDYLKSLGIEIVYKGIETSITPDDFNNFYRGNTISWRDLSDEKDKSRYAINGIKSRLLSKLKENRLDEIELIHEPGAGGTTLSRRLAYDLSTDYPTVIVNSYSHKKSIEALRIIYDQYTKGSLPLLIVVESHQVNNQALYRDLSLAKKNATIVVVHRGLLNSKNKKFFVQAQLEGKEIGAFESTFVTLVPEQRIKIRSITIDYSSTPQYITPVLYALTAYGKEYNGLEEYVSKSLRNITFEQKKLVGFICLIYYYTQKSVPVELFTSLLGANRSDLDLISILGFDNPIFELLHQESNDDQYIGNWRPRYSILGDEAMKIILNGGTENKENWKTYLANWLKDLISQVRSSIEFLNAESMTIFNSLFIERLYLEEVAYKEFTKAINDLTNPSDGMELFEELTLAYPNEAQFHGHYARYAYSEKIGIQDYDKAISEAELALDIQPENSVILHTLGMCYREKAQAIIHGRKMQDDEIDEVEKEVQNLTEIACEIFDESIEKDAQNLYGYESQIRTILSALNYGFKLHGGSSQETFIADPTNVWYAEKLDKVTILLEEALFTIDQLTKLDNRERINRSADFIHDCEGLFYKTLGKHIAAKNKFESLIKSTPSGYDYMRPHYRRMFITCLLASKVVGKENLFQAWEHVSESELDQCITYLEQNIFEDPGKIQNIKLWLQAVRYLKKPISISICINKVNTWTQSIKQGYNSYLEGYYYLYVLQSVKAISEGNSFDQKAIVIIREILEKMKPYVRNDKYCFEWFGRGEGIHQVVNHKELGEINQDFFERNKEKLLEVSGRIKDVISSQKGQIILDCGLEAFFVPNIGGFTDRNKNEKIKCYIGFRYDQIQAWSVTLFSDSRDDIRKRREIIELNPFIEDSPLEETKQILSIAERSTLPPDITHRKLEGPKVIGKIDLSKFDRKKKRR